MSEATDPKMKLPLELTLIVAATRNMGIGLNGTLPWTGLKQEMAYFARVTKRTSPSQNAASKNALIMGRRTWESIPPKFRPLKSRLNLMLSRSYPSTPLSTADLSTDGPIQTSSLSSALELLMSANGSINKTFVIGGGEIYRAALETKEAKRILLTRILSDFDCDTYFPLKLGDEGETEGWRKAGKEEIDGWVGENVPEGVQTEGDVKYVFEMWVRQD